MARIFEGYLSPYDVLMIMRGVNEEGNIHLGTVWAEKRNENYMNVRLTFEQIQEDTHNGTEKGKETALSKSRRKGV